MAVNKFVYFGETVFDLTSDTLTNANQLAKGIVGHTANGEVVTGTLESGGSLPEDSGLIITSIVNADGTQTIVLYGVTDEYGYTADSTESAGEQVLVLTGEEEEGIDIDALVNARVEAILQELEDGEY